MTLTQKDVEILHRIKVYIEENKHLRIRIVDLTTLFNIRTKKLTWGFKKLFDESVYNYFLRHSMAYAKQLLEEGAQVKEVAITLGYSTSGSFARTFFNIYKIHPAEIKLR